MDTIGDQTLETFYEQYGVNWSTTSRRELERMDTTNKVKLLCILMEGIKFDKILDFGCGMGDALEMLNERLHPKEAIGIDLSKTMVNYAKSEHPEFKFFQGSIKEIENYDVDLITFFDVLEHLPDIQAALHITKIKSKYIGIKIPLERTWLIDLLNFLRLKKKGISRDYESEGHLYEFDRKDVEMLLKKSGLQIVRSEVHHVTTKEFWFSENVKTRMKAKIGAIAKVKYLLYCLLGMVPFEITIGIMRQYLGDDFYILCKT